MKPSYNKFSRLLEERGVIAADVARETKITPSTFSDWKNGNSVPKVEKLALLARYFGVAIEDFLEEEVTE